MSRSSFSQATITAEQAGETIATWSLVSRTELLSFVLQAAASNANLNLGIPQVYNSAAAFAYAMAAFRDTSGNMQLGTFDPSVPSEWALPTGSALNIDTVNGNFHTLRPALWNDGASVISVGVVKTNGGAFQVQTSAITGSSNPVSISLANYGPTFGTGFANTGYLIRRVEAISRLQGSGGSTLGFIVAVGTHDALNGFTTLAFWYITSTNAYSLRSMIQMPFTQAINYIASVNVSNGGSGYSSPPTVSFNAGSGGVGAAVVPGGVNAIAVTNGGSGYSSAPGVSFSGGGGGSGAAATAVIGTLGNGSTGVTAIYITNAGSGYTSAPSVNFSGGGGSSAAATATIGIAPVTTVTVTAGGSGYTSVPTVIIAGAGGGSASAIAVLSGTAVSAIQIVNGGSGFAYAPAVVITGGGGSGATATCTVGVGTVTAITVANPGSGYVGAPTVTISGGGGLGATATATLSSGTISSFTIVTAGSGYTSIPTVTLAVGIGATATATVSGGHVTAVTVVNGGTGFAASPTVSFSGGGGSGAVATCTLVDWTTPAHYACYTFAHFNLTTNKIWVFASDRVGGRVVGFSVKSGVESSIVPVIGIDPDYGNTSFFSSSLTALNNLYYMPGTMTRTLDDGQTLQFDCCLVSEDLENWSVGERNAFFLQQPPSYGKLFVSSAGSQGSNKLIYGGNLHTSVAFRTALQGNPLASYSVDLSNPDTLETLQHVENTNAPDTLTTAINNASGSAEGLTALQRNSILHYQAGLNAVDGPWDVGEFSIDDIKNTIDTEGRKGFELVCRDLASKMIVEYNTPLDVQFLSRDLMTTTFKDLSAQILKTRVQDIFQATPTKPVTATPDDYDVILDGLTGLKHKGLMNPFAVYSDTRGNDDCVMKMTAVMPDTGESFGLSILGALFGATDAGQFYSVMIPKGASGGGTSWWGGKDRPKIVVSNLSPVDTAANTGGFNFTSRYTPLWYANGGTPTPVTLESGVKYISYMCSAWTATPGTTYDYAVITIGREVILYQKTRDYSKANCSVNAGYRPIMRAQFDESIRRFQPGKRRAGLIVSTDVWADQTTFPHAAYQPQELNLTDAANYINGPNNTISAHIEHPASDYNRLTNIASPYGSTNFFVGQWLNFSYIYSWARIRANLGGGVWQIDRTDRQGLPADTVTFGVRNDVVWGYAASGRRKQTASGVDIWTQPAGPKAIYPMLGRAAFVGKDGTSQILAFRWVASDGITHTLLSGSPRSFSAGTDLGWDTTSPLPSGAFNYGGSDPSAWMMIFHHNVFYNGNLTAERGLPFTGLICIEHEICRYQHDSYDQPADILDPVTFLQSYQTSWVTHIPVFYLQPQTQSAASARIDNFISSIPAVLGDDMSQLGALLQGQPVAGMVVDISTRGGAGNAVTGAQGGTANTTSAPTGDVPDLVVATNNGPAAGSSLGGYIVLNTAPASAVSSNDIVIVHGRRQFGTPGGTHPAVNTPVTYYPSTLANGKQASFVTVSRYETFAGRYLTGEDLLRKLTALAGVRGTKYRNLMTGASATVPYTFTNTSTPTTLPTIENYNNFVLDLTTHIPGNDTDSGGNITNAGRIEITFRNYYKLVIQQWSTTNNITNGDLGVLRIGLQTTSTDIDADGLGERWLDWIPIPYSQQSLSGVLTHGSGSVWTLAEDATLQQDIRLIVQDTNVAVEINGAAVYSFHLPDYVDDTGGSPTNTSYYKLTVGTIAVALTGKTIASCTASVRLMELHGEEDNVVLKLGNQVSQSIRELQTRRYMRSRASLTAAGYGTLEFSQYQSRDSTDPSSNPYILLDNTWKHLNTINDTQQAGHVQIQGKVHAESMDVGWITSYGYIFDAVTDTYVETVADALADARLLRREQNEMATRETVTAGPRFELQPEDQVQLQYNTGGGNNIPSHSTTTHNITTKRTTITAGSVETVFELRAQQAL